MFLSLSHFRFRNSNQNQELKPEPGRTYGVFDLIICETWGTDKKAPNENRLNWRCSDTGPFKRCRKLTCDSSYLSVMVIAFWLLGFGIEHKEIKTRFRTQTKYKWQIRSMYIMLSHFIKMVRTLCVPILFFRSQHSCDAPALVSTWGEPADFHTVVSYEIRGASSHASTKQWWGPRKPLPKTAIP